MYVKKEHALALVCKSKMTDADSRPEFVSYHIGSVKASPRSSADLAVAKL
jgi:hypothetical protein